MAQLAAYTQLLKLMNAPSLWFISGILKGTSIALTTTSAIFFGSGSGAVTAPPQLLAQQASERTPQTITGQLDQSSPVLEDDGSYYATHTFAGIAGESITINLTSNDFDTYLLLQSPTGDVIAQDDDGAGDTNSRITLTLPTTGIYILIINSYAANETGIYYLEWKAASSVELELALASQLNEQVIALYEAGNYEAAISPAENALMIREQQLGSDHLLTAASLNNLAALYRSMVQYEKAELLYQRALEIRERQLGANHLLTAASLNNLALLYESMGLYGNAESLYQRALEIHEQQLDSIHPSIASNLNNLAALYQSIGRYGEAELLYQRTLNIWDQQLEPQYAETVKTLGNLALLYRSMGRYADAEPFLQRALLTSEQHLGGDHPLTATSLNNLALLYESIGRYREAELLYQRALNIWEQQLGPDHSDTVTSLNNLAALYYRVGRYAEAEPIYHRVLDIWERQLGSDHPLTATGLNNLAELYRSMGRYENAELLMQRALKISEQQLGADHPNTASSLNNLALLYESMSRYGEAELLYKKALGIREHQLGSDHPDTAQSFINLASLFYAQEQLKLALSYLNKGVTAQERGLSQNLVGGSDANKRDYLATMVGTMDVVMSLHLNALSTDSDAAYLALTTLLQLKGRILDFFTNLRAQLANDPVALDLFDELTATSTQLSNLTLNQFVDVSVDSYQDQLDDLQVRVGTLENQLSRLSSDFANLTASPTLIEIQTALPSATALVEFIRYRPLNPTASVQERFGDDRYAAYILQPNGTIHGLDLGPAEAIDTAVSSLSNSLASSDTPLFQIKEEAQTLESLVMAPVRDTLGATNTIFLSPDGTLNLIPFEALVDESGNYLVESYQFRYLTSGRDLMRLDNVTVASNPALLIGNPTYGLPGELVAQADTPSTRSNTFNFIERIFPVLPGTQDEVELIAPKLSDALVYTQTNATEDIIKEQSQPSILHIATHGFFEPTEETINPLLQSGLILAGAGAGGQSGPDQDGILTALEVTGMNLSGTQLVVLSACETGLGKLTAGEGVYGLRRALVLAGSQSQVISLWKVDDAATQELMVNYYDRLLSGSPRDAALRETQLEFLESEEYSHPYYWAAFIGSGDWRPLQQ
ncbi:MAG: tetratricopeptide repeat protein [Cyanobacteria bacterium P01_E01_bin.6]